MTATSTATVVAAIDIGASSGRVVAGIVRDGTITIEVVHRFANGMQTVDGHLRWNLSGLYAEVLTGLAELAARYPGVVSIGIDTWAVDYGLLDADGRLLAEPIAYRDDRTDAVIGEVDGAISRERQYAISGLQFLPFNTIYQLAAEQRGDQWDRTAHAVLLPDLLAYWLTGELRTEITNASTTGLLDARRRSWSAEAFDALDLPADLLPAADRARGDRRRDHGRGRRADGAAGHHRRGRGRFPRHRLGRGRRAGRGPGHRVRVLGHLVAGRAGARRAGDHRRQPGRQLHQRGGRGRAGAFPAQRRGPLAAAGVPAGLVGRRPGVRPRGPAGARRASYRSVDR